MISFLVEVLTKTSRIVCVGAKSSQEPRAVGCTGWRGIYVPPGCSYGAVGLFALCKQCLHQLLQSISDGSSQTGLLWSCWPAKPHKAANRTPEPEGFLIKPQSQSEQILTTCYRICFCKIKAHLTISKWRTKTRCVA